MLCLGVNAPCHSWSYLRSFLKIPQFVLPRRSRTCQPSSTRHFKPAHSTNNKYSLVCSSFKNLEISLHANTGFFVQVQQTSPSKVCHRHASRIPFECGPKPLIFLREEGVLSGFALEGQHRRPGPLPCPLGSNQFFPTPCVLTCVKLP